MQQLSEHYPIASVVIGVYILSFTFSFYWMVFHSRIVDEDDFEI